MSVVIKKSLEKDLARKEKDQEELELIAFFLGLALGFCMEKDSTQKEKDQEKLELIAFFWGLALGFFLGPIAVNLLQLALSLKL